MNFQGFETGPLAGDRLNRKFGTNEAVGTTLTPIVAAGVVTTFDTPVQATTASLSSDDAADTTQLVYVQGIDENFDRVTAIVQANGLATVALPGKWLRITRMACVTGNVNVGDITAQIGISDVCQIPAGFGQSQHCHDFIPRRFRQHTTGLYILNESRNANAMTFNLVWREWGGPERVLVHGNLNPGESYSQQATIPQSGNVGPSEWWIEAAFSSGTGSVDAQLEYYLVGTSAKSSYAITTEQTRIDYP
jgi:hypothetical protein